jgi:hypothetical protein
MNRMTRGTTYVSLMWVVVLIVLVLAGAGGMYMFAAERSDLEAQIASLKTAEAAATKRGNDLNARVAELSKHVGFRADEKNPLSESDSVAIVGMIKQVQEAYAKDGVGGDADTLARVVERMRVRIDDLNRELGEAKAQVSTSEAARGSLQQNLADMTRQKDEAYATLTKQAQDERDRHTSAEAAATARADDLNRRITDLEGRAKADKAELETKVSGLEGEMRKREGRIAELAKKVEIIKLPDEPDGSVVQVSNANRCWIDLGTRQMLRRGTRFEVFNYAKNGTMRKKGMIEVTKVEDSMAEATVVDLKDRYDPITKGDKISAPNYDPEMPREFVLAGRFPTGYSRAMVADRLRQLGAKVVEKVGPSTDFLVMGDRDTPLAAAEGESSGDAAAGDAETVADSEEMKLAQLYRVQILPVREILEFLKYE